jgi:hypothetical protein
MDQRTLWKIVDAIFILLLIIFSYQFTFLAGERGFFAFDQSIVFDGGYRIYIGQVPFKDFVIPFGPVVFWMQGIVFHLLGISYASYIFGAAIINVLASLCSMVILRLLFHQQRFVAYLGSAITAIWFYPPFGTPWPDQTAFFYSLIALMIMLASLMTRQYPAWVDKSLLLLSGLLTFIAFISKQNAGVLALSTIGILALIKSLPNMRIALARLAMIFSGWTAGLLAFSIWLAWQSNIATFVKHFVVIPTNIGISRLTADIPQNLELLLLAAGSTEIKVIIGFSLFTLIVFVSSKYTSYTNLELDSDRHFSAIVMLSLLLYQNLFILTTNNQPENAFPFIGLILATNFGLALPVNKINEAERRDPRRRIISVVQYLVSAVIFIMIIYIGFIGINTALSRKVHSIFENSEFSHYLRTGNLSALRWGEPTRIGKLIRGADVDKLASFLENREENFFIFPDFTILYGVVGVPSPQPILWFHKGLTYSNTYDQELDSSIVADLRRNEVNIVVMEKESWFQTSNRLDDFPQLKSYLEENFKKERNIGIFVIYTRMR